MSGTPVKEQRRQLEQAVKHLVDAEVAYSWKGSQTEAEDIEAIEHDLAHAKARYATLLDRLFPQTERKKTTGRFATREELVATVWREWRKTPRNQTQIARFCRVSATTVNSILKGPAPEEES